MHFDSTLQHCHCIIAYSFPGATVTYPAQAVTWQRSGHWTHDLLHDLEISTLEILLRHDITTNET